jgi:hypothetical protein
MPKFCISFGQQHVHRVNGRTFDKDSIAVIERPTHEEARNAAFEYFGDKFFTSYDYDKFIADGSLKYYPRGLIEVENK